MRTRTSILIALIFLFVATHAFAQLSRPQFADKESAVQQIKFIESGQVLYNYSWTMTKADQGGKTIITVVGKGDNNKQGKDTITWEETSVIEVRDDGLRTLSWEKYSQGAEQENWKMVYDWTGKKVTYRWEDRVSGKSKNKSIDLADNALAGDSMLFAMRGFPFASGKGATIEGRIIDSSGMVLGGRIELLGEETIDTAFGSLPCYKLQMKPTGLIGIVAPTMYIWYTKQAPHIMVRYDGRDDGLTSPRTKKVLLKFEPASALK